MVSEKDIQAAYKKGQVSGRASANAKKRKTSKRRRRTYRMKRPDRQVKQAIGKFQHKHPYVAAAIEAPVVIGAVAGTLQAAGFEVFDDLNWLRRTPIFGKIYTGVADPVFHAMQRIAGMFS